MCCPSYCTLCRWYHLLTNKVIKILEGWLSLFIWKKRKARLKMSKLQRPSSDGGLHLPSIRFYQLAVHLRVIFHWFKNSFSLLWFDIESFQCNCPLWNLLFLNSSAIELCSNPISCGGCAERRGCWNEVIWPREAVQTTRMREA